VFPSQSVAVPSGPALFGVAMLALGAVVALVSLWYAWHATQALRAPSLGSVETVSAGDRVTVEGRAHPGPDDPLASPLRDRACLAVQATVEERRLVVLPVPLPTWVQLARTSVAQPFRVRTPTSDCPVVAPTSSLVCSAESVTEVAPGETVDGAAGAFERRHDVPPRTVWHGRPPVVGAVAGALSLGRRRYREGTLESGGDVLVAGRLVETEGEGGIGIDPDLVSTRSRAATLARVARTSLVGLAAGGLAMLVGALLWLA
jgi:hypothetical protein